MKLHRYAAALVLGLASLAVLGADKNESWANFWERLRLKIEQLTPDKKLGSTTAVGGVRGAAVETGDVYWKGESQPQAISPDELGAFRQAMELADAKKDEQARAAFAAFVKDYPGSTLKADAEQAMARLIAGR